MADLDVDALLLSLGSDLPYLTGYRAPETERLTMLVLRAEGAATLVLPELEAPRAEGDPSFDVVAWSESEDPIGLVASLVGSAETIAIGDQTWARFVLDLQRALPTCRFRAAEELVSPLRMVKTESELSRLRTAGAAADRVIAMLADTTFSGRTERDLAHVIEAATVAEGHDVSGFAIVGSGPNGASPHHAPTDRVIEGGDVVVVDFGGTYGGYWSDTTRTFSVGEPDRGVVAAYLVLRAAHDAALETIRPGVPAQDVDRAARRVIEAAGFGDRFIHRTGHGIGLDTHEEPYIIEGNSTLLGEGMAFSVEPGIYIPGEWGMRIEDIVSVTADACERLNRSPRRLAVVG